ncbi:MAG: ABC transporter permease [Gemmobacter sp.]
MEPLTWTGSLGPVLNPLLMAGFALMLLAFLARILLAFAALFGLETEGTVQAVGGGAAARTRGLSDYVTLAMTFGLYLVVAVVLAYILLGLVLPTEAKGIVGRASTQFLPVWIALAVTFALSFKFKRRLGLYGKLFDSPVGMTGFAIVMFWVFAAFFADMIVTHDPLAQLSGLKNAVPGSAVENPAEGIYAYYLLGGDHLARDVFSRMVMGARSVLSIAPAATAFAFMVGVTLGLPAGYFGGKLDTILSFVSNLVLAFPVILLFYLLVTPEIRDTGIPVVLAAVLFLFPIIFFIIFFNARYFTDPPKRNIYVGITLVIGLWAYSGLAFNLDPTGVFSMDPNLLNVFVSVVFVNSPTVYRIVRGIVMDIRARDYVAAGQTRGEGPWYIMLWEILPNARGPLIVDFCLRIGYTTILLGTLGFFGLGVSPDSPDWGSTIDDGRKLLSLFPHPAIVPALSLMSLVLGLNLLADGLREESLRD